MKTKTKLPKGLTSGSESDGFTVKCERERKYLVDSSNLPELGSAMREEIVQSYYKDESTGNWLRARSLNAGEDHILTIKTLVPGGNDSYERREAEKSITRQEFELLVALSDGVAMSKTRYRIPFGERVIELDIYHKGTGISNLDGLITAEVEFGSMEELLSFKPPEWFGAEVSSDKRYRNKALAQYGIPETLRES